MKRFWSDRIRDLTPYCPGEQPRGSGWIKLNTNENPYPPSPAAIVAIQKAAGEGLRLYPDADGTELKEALCDVLRVAPDRIFVGNGSDEVLAMAFQAFFDEGAEILLPDITYSFYPVYAALFGIRCRTIPLNADFSVPAERFCGGDGVVLANPNAPTGIGLSRGEIVRILESNPDVAVIVDEAYVDFGGESVLPLIDAYDNLLVVQTASKSRALAGLRVGFAFGNPNIIQALDCVKNSFNSYTLDRLALAGAAAAVRDTAYFEKRREEILRTRKRTAETLRELGFFVYPSQTNFLFISHPARSGADLFSGLREKKILVRHFDQPRIENCLRVTIGSEEEMNLFLDAAAELVKGA